MSTIRERDALAIHGDDDTPEQMQAVTDRGDLIVIGDALAEAVATYAEYVQPFADHAGMTSLRAAIANWKAAVDQ